MARGPGKGNTNNPNGRKKGTPNKTTQEARQLFINIMNGEIENIKAALDKIRGDKPEKYLECLAKLFQYTMPKQLDVTSDGESISTVKLIRGNEGTKDKAQQGT